MIIPYASIAASVVAAALGLRAATYPIRDSIDDMMADFGRQGKWASWAAVTTAVAVILQGVDRLMQ
ncbi:hypothetical protein [Mesorhizobium sp. M4B.F.Ca.ET.017.02.2.1]|uniref:hypothetical protein n=1 Tax=Mesorhizobium sp. M4B.F.Ca.ET.017.02.2.1 TaxID=2496649 RepID=UPI000FCBA0FC|nr:hypothetical protein [Mesorhizobium sp. M4B.F.Ca.ET.017.02.2.1]RVD30530.1 hypothetical protein EN738_05730 [Mesorhizobium sp. M4B.F.Ca.ET.017.02.2.1]